VRGENVGQSAKGQGHLAAKARLQIAHVLGTGATKTFKKQIHKATWAKLLEIYNDNKLTM